MSDLADAQARTTNRLLAKQIAVQLETNRLLRQIIEAQGGHAAMPEVGSPAGDFAPKSGLGKLLDNV